MYSYVNRPRKSNTHLLTTAATTRGHQCVVSRHRAPPAEYNFFFFLILELHLDIIRTSYTPVLCVRVCCTVSKITRRSRTFRGSHLYGDDVGGGGCGDKTARSVNARAPRPRGARETHRARSPIFPRKPCAAELSVVGHTPRRQRVPNPVDRARLPSSSGGRGTLRARYGANTVFGRTRRVFRRENR